MEKRLRILLMHPYGSLGSWNHRLGRQAELMAERCELRILSRHTDMRVGLDNIFQSRIRDVVRDFRPDVLYINGFVIAHHIIRNYPDTRIVYDMGSFIARNNIIEQAKLNYVQMEKLSAEKLRIIAGTGHSAGYYKTEKKVMENVDAIVCWEGREANLVRKIYDVGDKLKEISMIVHDTPSPLPWEDKEGVISIAAKWSDMGKKWNLLKEIGDKQPMFIVGKRSGDVQSLGHSDLMDILNKTRVLFVPFTCGGIGVVCEALKCGCNVVAYDWYSFNAYLSDELIIDSSEKVVSRAVEVIKKALEKYYLPKKPLPKVEEVIDKILKVCENASKI